jgi:ATP-dependent DNA helicase PIF1
MEQKVLYDIRGMLQSMGKDINTFPLLDIDETYDNTDVETREVIQETNINVDKEYVSLASSLNHEQRLPYDEILATVDGGDGGVFFVDGPGGTQKTNL